MSPSSTRIEIPSSQQARWHDHPQRRDAEVRRRLAARRRGASGEAEDAGRWPAAAVLVAATATGGVVALSGAEQATAAAQEPPANTATVEQGKLSAMVSQDGTLTYRARSDGSPYSVINQARGVVHRAARERRQGRLRRRALSGGRQAGAAAVRHGPGLPRPARGRCGPATSVSSTATCTCAAPATPSPPKTEQALEALQRRKGARRDRRARPRRRGLPARGGADRQGDRPARRIRPAGCTGRCRPPPTRCRCR